MIIDADGLNSLAKYGVDCLFNKKCDVVLTPHIGEFLRLTNQTKEQLNDSFIESAKAFALKYKVNLLLKSAMSVITDGTETFLNTTGCAGMAKGGSGDVLSGVIAGLLARNDDVLFTSAVASYIFGLAGEYAVKEQNEYTITASDIINSLPKVINNLDK